MAVNEAEDVDEATEVAMNMEEATTPTPVLTKGRSNTSKFLPTGDLQRQPKEGSNNSTSPVPGSVFVPVANRGQGSQYGSQNSHLGGGTFDNYQGSGSSYSSCRN